MNIDLSSNSIEALLIQLSQKLLFIKKYIQYIGGHSFIKTAKEVMFSV